LTIALVITSSRGSVATACMRELIPIIDMVQSLAVALSRQTGVVNMKVSDHEDNLGALVWPRRCHHDSPLEVNITQSRLFGFERRFINGVLSF